MLSLSYRSTVERSPRVTFCPEAMQFYNCHMLVIFFLIALTIDSRKHASKAMDRF
jgi:hypothetical protein